MSGETKVYDIAVIGAGIVGLATAMELLNANPRVRVVVLEAEGRVASHQTGNNSGVIHSGLYYKPGSLKATNCTLGRALLYSFCETHSIPHQRCGKIVVAVTAEEIPRLDRLEERGVANGLQGLRRLGKEELKEHEPHVAGIAGLFVPDTGIVDYVQVAETYSRLFRDRGGEIRFKARVTNIRLTSSQICLETLAGEVVCKNLINCAGLHSDRIAGMSGLTPGLKIVPFRGEYYELKKERHHLVKNLIYPVPDPQFPFLGVHFTRMINGGVEAGPNAVLAMKREGYKKLDFSLRDNLELLGYRGFWVMAFKHWRMGMGEIYRSLSKSAFTRALQRLLPEIEKGDLVPGGAGVRAQALEANGFLVDDFRILEAARMVHVLNAPSPAATASINIGRTIASKALKNFNLL